MLKLIHQSILRPSADKVPAIPGNVEASISSRPFVGEQNGEVKSWKRIDVRVLMGMPVMTGYS